VGILMSLVTVDEKYRVLLNKEIREKVGISKGDKLIAIPIHNGILLLSLKGKSFTQYLKGFNFKEEAHEASKFLFK